jgi:alpha-beta hydrolase superfamily lysophospholipase
VSRGSFTGERGLEIAWRSWPGDGEPRAVVVIAHGAGEHVGRYEHVAARLVAERYAVYGLDHRGHGHSEGSRALVDRVAFTVSDLDQLVLLAAGEHSGLDVFLLGHSMGGCISVLYALSHQQRLSGLLLSGPLAALDAAPAPVRVLAAVLSALTPRLPLFAVDPTLVSRDPAVVKAYEDDPLVYHGKLPVRTVSELAGAVASFPDAVSAITIPTLIMYGTDDKLAPPAGSVMLSERIGAGDKALIPYEGLYHEILNEPEQKQVMDDMCAWLNAHIGVPAAQRGPGA